MVNTCDYLCLVLATAALLITGSEGQCNHGYRSVTSSLTVLTSPGYYENGTYPPNSQCRWLLEAVDGGAMNVFVHTMELQGGRASGNCTSGDRVLLYNGRSTFNSPLLAILCRRSDVGRHFYSTGRFVFVEFFSGESVSGIGFRLEMRSMYRYLGTTTAIATKTTSHGSSETGGSSSFSLLYLLIAFGAVFCFTCLVCFCRCVIDKGCNSNPSRNSRNPAQNPRQNTPNHAHHAQNHAHFALSHAPSTIPANLRTEFGPQQLNNGVNNAHTASGNVSSDGNVNVGYSNFGEAPPPYDEVVVSGNGSGQNVALPSYTEAIRMSDITPKVDTVDN